MTAIDDGDLRLEPSVSARASGLSCVIAFLTIAMCGAGLSLGVTGFVFGGNNNLFHLPIVATLYDKPQFADDAFIQSLRWFSAGPWRLLEGAERYIDPERLFLALAALSRVLAFAGFLACATLIGVRSVGQRLLFVLLLAVTPMMLGVSVGGGGGLFLANVSHSELANGLILLSCACAARRRFDLALALNGAVFFCNAFMAVWTFAPLAAIAALQLRQGEIAPGAAMRQCCIGAAAFLLAAAPVIADIVANPEFGVALSFDYRDFLQAYWPGHFLIGSIPGEQLIWLVLIIATAALAFHALGSRASAFQAALAGFCVVYTVGIVAPFVTSSPMALNLHLLRSSACLQMFAALGVLCLIVRWATDADIWRARVAAPTLVLAFCCAPQTLSLTPILLHFARKQEIRRATGSIAQAKRPWLVAIATAATVFALAMQIRSQMTTGAAFEEARAEWTATARWAKESTLPDAQFLPPVYDLRTEPQAQDATASTAFAALSSVVFETVSERRIWVDFKRGAAVMWTPSYHAVWRPRIAEMLALKSLTERRAYAARNGIAYVVDLCEAADGAAPVFMTTHLCVFESR